jgi:glyoxylase-like metal-dependent hydrolase (beta-lactamase superfamily II)
MHESRPFPIVADVTEMVDGWDRMRELASDPALIIPGHDPLVMDRFPAPAAALRGIAVRLDPPPGG